MFTEKDKKKLAEIINQNFSRHGNYIDFQGFSHDLTEWLTKDDPQFNMEEFTADCTRIPLHEYWHVCHSARTSANISMKLGFKMAYNTLQYKMNVF